MQRSGGYARPRMNLLELMRRILYFTPTLHPLAVCTPMMPQGPKHTSKFDVKLVFGLEDLDVEGTVGGKVLHSPGSKNGLVILGEVWLVIGGLPLRVGRQRRLGGVGLNSPQLCGPPRSCC